MSAATQLAGDMAPVVVSTLPDIQRMVAAYLKRPGLAVLFDIETTGLDPRQDKLVMMQFQQVGHRPVILDCRSYRPQDSIPLTWITALTPLFTGSLLVVGHNLKFDLGFLSHQLGIRAKRVYDTQIAEQVLYGLGKTDGAASGILFSLKALAERRGLVVSKEERNWFIDLHHRLTDWENSFPAEQVSYAAQDVSVLHVIMTDQRRQLTERNLLEVARLEMQCLPTLVDIETTGVLVDVDGWRGVIREKEIEASALEEQCLDVFGSAILQTRIARFDEAFTVWQAWDRERTEALLSFREAFDQTGEKKGWGTFKTNSIRAWNAEHPQPKKPTPDGSPPNLGSVKQLLEAFAVLGIPATSTDSDRLSVLEADYPAVELLLKWRKAIKFVQSFGESLLKFVDPTTGRIHPQYVQIGASTGRMSCSLPNWQQLPARGDGARLRALVHAQPGHVLLTADFSNIELRILADMSGDTRMLDMFAAGIDLHSYTARMMFGLPETVDVEHEEAFPGVTYRAVAKTINFGLVYGMSATKLSRTLKIRREQAADLFAKYFDLYPGVQRWLAEQRRSGVSQLSSRTYAGRKRFYKLPPEPPFPQETRDTSRIRNWQTAIQEWKATKHRIERQACNSPIQGTSADITKLALVNLYLLLPSHMDAHVIAVVHDEIVLEVDEDSVDTAREFLADAMYAAAVYYLKRVRVPPTKVVQSLCWKKG